MPTKTFTYTGGAQTWVVPAGVTSIFVECVGGVGGAYNGTGKAGYASGNLAVTPGESIFFNVGGQGGAGSTSGAAGAGGWPGGGAGGTGHGGGWQGGPGGGGCSDVRQGGGANNYLQYRKIVAGGGGGRAVAVNAAAGGGSTGATGLSLFGGKGGSQTAGGKISTRSDLGGAPANGGSGAGGHGGANTLQHGGGGGGAGYWGGAGGGLQSATGRYYSGGGGGSNYVGGVTNSTSVQGYVNATGNGWIRIAWGQMPNAINAANLQVLRSSDNLEIARGIDGLFHPDGSTFPATLPSYGTSPPTVGVYAGLIGVPTYELDATRVDEQANVMGATLFSSPPGINADAIYLARMFKVFKTPTDLDTDTACKLRLPAPYGRLTGPASNPTAAKATALSGSDYTKYELAYDGVQVEEGTSAGIYTAGDLPDSTWLGTPYASPSSRENKLLMSVSAQGVPLFPAGLSRGSGKPAGTNFVDVYRASGTWSVATNTFVPVPFTATTFPGTRVEDDGSLWNGGTTFLAPIAGLYFIWASVYFPVGAGRLQLSVTNAAQTAELGRTDLMGVTNTTILTTCHIFWASAGASYIIRVFQTSGANPTTFEAHSASHPCRATWGLLLAGGG